MPTMAPIDGRERPLLALDGDRRYGVDHVAVGEAVQANMTERPSTVQVCLGQTALRSSSRPRWLARSTPSSIELRSRGGLRPTG